MSAKRLVFMTITTTVLSLLVSYDKQTPKPSGQTFSPADIDQFSEPNFQQATCGPATTLGICGFMKERPLIETGSQAAQVYRFFLQTRPYNSPVVVRLSVGCKGTGELE